MLATLAEVATVASGIALVLSVLFVGYELRVNAKLTRASNTHALVELSSSFVLQVMQDRELARLWSGEPARDRELDELDRFRYRTLVTWWLIFHENIHFQYHEGLLDQEVYVAWDYELRMFIRAHHLDTYWPEIKEGFQGPFARYLDTVMTG